jgi:hypothetical protein
MKRRMASIFACSAIGSGCRNYAIYARPEDSTFKLQSESVQFSVR